MNVKKVKAKNKKVPIKMKVKKKETVKYKKFQWKCK